jgi:predicted branched-subunit amino acid permease
VSEVADEPKLYEDPRFRDGFRLGAPYAIASTLLAVSFGVLAQPLMGNVAPIVMSLLVFAGSAQFAATAVLSAGGGVGAAIAAAILLNMRYVPMGIALAP